ncbi:MAG TPA: GNAT family N-acetyltransferase [Flavobacterium sp.]|jgi:hypothetical protein
MKDLSQIEVIDNVTESQFEIEVDGQLAFIEYIIKEDKIYLTHTSVPKGLEGQGVGTVLVQKTLDRLTGKELVLLPMCSFVANYVNENPKYQSLLSDGYQM